MLTISNGLEQKTDLNIQPAKVRLKNTVKDGYCWLHKPEVEHIFSKCLSRQTLAAYEEICSGVGVSFEAIAAPRTGEDSIGLGNPIVPQSAPQLSVSDGSSEIESTGTHETYDMSTELLYQLLLSVQQSLVAERADRERQDCEVRALQIECERLTGKYTETTDVMCKCLHALDAITASVGALREEISESINRIALASS